MENLIVEKHDICFMEVDYIRNKRSSGSGKL